jgi:anti-anti-sigma factor
MSNPEFQHMQMATVKDVTVIEIISKNLQGPKAAQELGGELAQVTAQSWAKRLLLDFRQTRYLSSTGFAVLFRIARDAKAKGIEIKICGMSDGVQLGAEIVGLTKVVELYPDQRSALQAFQSA